MTEEKNTLKQLHDDSFISFFKSPLFDELQMVYQKYKIRHLEMDYFELQDHKYVCCFGVFYHENSLKTKIL